jgi:hypothetical protein
VVIPIAALFHLFRRDVDPLRQRSAEQSQSGE